jgi:hypothetical protein
MEAGTQALATVANQWLARFEAALSAGDAARLQSLLYSKYLALQLQASELGLI